MNFEDGEVLTSGNQQNFIIYKECIIPNKAIKNKRIYTITHKSSELFLAGFVVVTDDNKVSGIILLGAHPNQDENLYYCLPKRKLYKEFTKEYFSLIVNNIYTYYLDDCYFDPSDYLIFKEAQSIKIQL